MILTRNKGKFLIIPIGLPTSHKYLISEVEVD